MATVTRHKWAGVHPRKTQSDQVSTFRRHKAIRCPPSEDTDGQVSTLRRHRWSGVHPQKTKRDQMSTPEKHIDHCVHHRTTQVIRCPPSEHTLIRCPPSEDTSIRCPPSEHTSIRCPPSEHTSIRCPPSEHTLIRCPPPNVKSEQVSTL